MSSSDDDDELPSSPPRTATDESSSDDSSDDDSSSPRRDDPQPSGALTISIGDAVYDEETRHAGVVEDIFPDETVEINWKGRESSSRATASSATTNRRAFSRAAKKGPGSYKSRRSFSSTHAKDLALRFRAAAIRREPRAPVATTTFAAAAPAAPAEGVGAGVRKLFSVSGYHDGKVTKVLKSGGAEITWEDGESTTLDQHDYERALERYKRDHNMQAPRPSAADVQPAADAESSSEEEEEEEEESSSSDDDVQDAAEDLDEAVGAADDDESSSSSDEDEEPNQASNLPPPPTAVSRSETPEAAVVEDDWDEESDEDEDRRVANLSSQVVDPSQHTSQHASQDSRLSLVGAAAVDGSGAIDAAAMRARILAARPESIVPPASATSAPKLRIVHSRHGEWWGHAGKLRIPGSDELRTTLHELGGESSWLGDKRKYCDIDLKRLNAEGYDIILVDRGASIAYQRQFKDTKQDFARTELERKYGHTVVRKPCVVAYSTDNGVPLETYEVVAVVAINTATTRAAWTPAAVDQVEVLLDTMKGHHNPAKRGSNTRSGKMFMAGALVRRWTAEELKKRKKRGNGRIDTYRINRAAAAEANYDGYISPLETVLTIMAALEAAVSPRLHRARLAVSAAINAPAIVGGFPREIGPSVTLALSQGYVSSQHLDSSGKWAWESIAWPPCRRAPSDWTFAIPGAGLLVDLSGPGGVYVTLNASRTVHGTLRSEICPDHDGIGIADILKHDMLSRNVVDAFEGGCKKRPALGAHN